MHFECQRLAVSQNHELSKIITGTIDALQKRFGCLRQISRQRLIIVIPIFISPEHVADLEADCLSFAVGKNLGYG